jgi:hypothetical protein
MPYFPLSSNLLVIYLSGKKTQGGGRVYRREIKLIISGHTAKWHYFMFVNNSSAVNRQNTYLFSLWNGAVVHAVATQYEPSFSGCILIISPLSSV